MDFIFDICVPTVDIYTDIALIYRYMFIPQCIDVGFDIHNLDFEYIFSQDLFGNDTIFNSCNRFGTNPKYGLSMLCPIIISTIFIFGQWLRMEDSTKKRFYTFPLLLLQLYPQYRTLKVLYMALWKRDIRWKKDKEILQRNLKSIGSDSKTQQTAAHNKKTH